MQRPGLAVLATCIVVPVLAVTILGRAGKPVFTPGYDEAVRRAEAEARLLIVDFTASWCAPCNAMDRTTWHDADIRDWLAANAVAVQVDVDDQWSLAREYSVFAMPTVVAMRGGREVDRVTGYRSAADLRLWLDAVGSGGSRIDVLRDRAVNDDGDPDVPGMLALASALRRAGDGDEASVYLLWLWEHASEHDQQWREDQLPELADEVASLAARHTPTREAFAAVLAGDEQATRSGPVDADGWRDLIELGVALDLVDRVAVCVRETAASGRALPDLPGKVKRSLFEALVAAGHLADAALVDLDLEYLAKVAIWENRSASARVTRLAPDWLSGPLGAFGRGDLRAALAQLSVVALLQDDDDLAETLGDKLLAVDDGPGSRLVLVRVALDHGQARPVHERWLREAGEFDLQASVQAQRDALEQRLQTLLADAGVEDG